MNSRSNPFKLYELYVLSAPLPPSTLVQVQNMKTNSEKALRNLVKIPGNAVGVEVVCVDSVMNRAYEKSSTSEDENRNRHAQKTRQLIERMKNEFQKLHFPALVCKKTNQIYVLNDILDVLREVDFVSEFVKILSEKMSQICDVTTSMLEMQQKQQQQRPAALPYSQVSNNPSSYYSTQDDAAADAFESEQEFEAAYAELNQYAAPGRVGPQPPRTTTNRPSTLFSGYTTRTAQSPTSYYAAAPATYQNPQPNQQAQQHEYARQQQAQQQSQHRFHMNYTGGTARKTSTAAPASSNTAAQPVSVVAGTNAPTQTQSAVQGTVTSAAGAAVATPGIIAVPTATAAQLAARQHEIDELKRFASTLTSKSRRPSTTNSVNVSGMAAVSAQKSANIIPAMDLLSSDHSTPTTMSASATALPIAKSSDDIFALFQVQNIPLISDKVASK